MDYNTLIKQYPGYAGWGQTEAMADFNATGGSGKGGSSGGSSGGNTALDVSSIPSALEFAKTSEAPIDATMAEYAMTARGQEKPLDIYNKLSENAGLPTLRKTASTLQGQIANLEDTIKGIEPMVEGTTKNSLVTAAQRARMIAQGQKIPMQNLAELSTVLGRVSQGIQAGEANIGNIVGLALQGQEKELEPLKLKLSVLSDRASRLMSGFTTDAQNKLQVIMANWNRSNQLTDQETEQAFELLKQEKDYKNTLDKMLQESNINLSEYAKKLALDKANTGSGSNIASYYNTGSGYYSNGMQSVSTNKPPLSSFVVDPYTEAYNAANERVFGKQNLGSMAGLDWSKIDLSGVK